MLLLAGLVLNWVYGSGAEQLAERVGPLREILTLDGDPVDPDDGVVLSLRQFIRKRRGTRRRLSTSP